jgi:L,D-transpeptidase catalytic domain
VSFAKAICRTLIVTGALSFSSIAAMAMKVDISVSKVTQKMTVRVDGQEEFVWLVSTGGQGYDTPSGTYKIFRMEKEHFSKEWDDAPMPYSMFFTGQGHAIHGSYHIKRLGTRASHGCVRLAPENAAILFDLVDQAGYKNSTVTIKGGFFDGGSSSEQVVSADGKPRRSFFWFLTHPKTKIATVEVKVKKLVKVIKAEKSSKPVKAATTTKLEKPLKKKKLIKTATISGALPG